MVRVQRMIVELRRRDMWNMVFDLALGIFRLYEEQT